MRSDQAWQALPAAEQVVFRAAWKACARGTVGVGCAILDESGQIISSARNATRGDGDDDLPIAGTYVAHAEINALAQIPTERNLDRCTLITSILPCLMCAGAAVMAHVGQVRYLTADPLFPDFLALRQVGEIARRQWPVYQECPQNEWTVLALVLSAHSKAVAKPDGLVMTTYELLEPEAASLLRQIVRREIFARSACGGADIPEVLAEIWDDLLAAHHLRQARQEKHSRAGMV
jgi:tRNA(Arg) A34 adenosine deaminase TadA